MRERLMVKRRCILTVAMVTGLAVVGLVFLPAAVAGEAPPPPAPPASGAEVILLTRFAPWMIMVMVLGVLAALMGSLLMIYWYISSVRTTEFHRQILLDAVTEYRFQKLMEGTRAFSAQSTPPFYPPDESPDQRAQRQERARAEEAQREQEYNELVRGRRQTARQEAEILVPLSLSVAGMDITGTFFIELTAILTIIFGILILGLLGVLGTREISPILAAIAGYVLGKTTSGQGQISPAASPTVQTAGGQAPPPAGPR